MNLTYGIIVVVGLLIAGILGMIAADPGYLENAPPKPGVEKPKVCSNEENPVCGIDGKTYDNLCKMHVEGVELSYQGKCVAVELTESEPTGEIGMDVSSTDYVVSIPAGASLQACAETNECFLPASLNVAIGETVLWSNDDNAAHTVTSGTSASGPDGLFDSGMILAGESFEFTFDSEGIFDYYCVVHPWMTGEVIVGGSDEIKVEPESLSKPMMDGWDRMESVTDPGIGHEQHQLAIILPPSDNVYSGNLMYDASENIQLVALHGPLAEGKDKGQAIWTPDGETKFALTFVDPMNAKGEWQFAGNAIAVHTKNPTPFIVDYKVDYEEKPMSDTVMTGTVESVQDPGVGHESHQLAMILAPSSTVYSGILSYSASEPIQLVSLRGPIGVDEQPEKTWTPDGETIFELTFVDPENAMGSWEFSGNALAVHTKNPTPFTVSYSVSAIEIGAPEKPISSAMPRAPMTHTVEIVEGSGVPGCEENNECYNPYSLEIQVGDTVVWDNADTASHTVTAGTSADGPSGVFDSSLFLSGDTFEFTFNEAGVYPYFCMVHPWMTGEITVNKVEEMIVIPPESSTASVSEEPVMEVKSSGPAEVSMEAGSSVPGCEEHNECFVPYQIEISSGESVTWNNVDSAAHTITSGIPGSPDGVFDSGMVMSGQSFEFTFTESGEYDYYCMVHPWMTGKVMAG